MQVAVQQDQDVQQIRTQLTLSPHYKGQTTSLVIMNCLTTAVMTSLVTAWD